VEGDGLKVQAGKLSVLVPAYSAALIRLGSAMLPRQGSI